MRFGSLFSGIGGMDLGLERAGMECAWQVEINDYATRVLYKHWPYVPKFRDVRECGAANLERVDLICGGFPCQDISVANQSESGATGLDGARSGLWAEFARVLREIRPRFALIENSPMLTARGLDGILCDLAEIGFDATWTTIRASSLGAVHRRERMYVIAYANGDGLEGRLLERLFADESVATLDRVANWPPVSEPLGIRAADGTRNRVDRTRCVGNAVVPQVAQWIGERILSGGVAHG